VLHTSTTPRTIRFGQGLKPTIGRHVHIHMSQTSGEQNLANFDLNLSHLVPSQGPDWTCSDSTQGRAILGEIVVLNSPAAQIA